MCSHKICFAFLKIILKFNEYKKSQFLGMVNLFWFLIHIILEQKFLVLVDLKLKIKQASKFKILNLKLSKLTVLAQN